MDGGKAITANFEAVPTFGDVPGDYWAWEYVEAIHDHGITVGCGDGSNYCPEQNVNRVEMALYIGRAIGGLPEYVPAPCGEERFDDVPCDYLSPGNPPSLFYKAIEYIADAQGNSTGRAIAYGCIADDPGTPDNEARYCPDVLVNRVQMAVYIGRAIGGLDEYVAAPCGEERFTDVLCDDYPAEFYKAVQYIADAENNIIGRAITIGCQDGSKYCPEDAVTRAAMAVYIARAFLGMD
jgi:Pyruvate/2-oxoacid:ferredoxin oxidoreductase delta subunit